MKSGIVRAPTLDIDVLDGLDGLAVPRLFQFASLHGMEPDTSDNERLTGLCQTRATVKHYRGSETI